MHEMMTMGVILASNSVPPPGGPEKPPPVMIDCYMNNSLISSQVYTYALGNEEEKGLLDDMLLMRAGACLYSRGRRRF